MKTLIKNTKLISMDQNRPKLEENMDILINNDIIEKIGNGFLPDSNTKIIDASNKVTMPGLINTHAHTAMSIFRETLDGYNLQEWLEDKIWPLESKLTGEDIYYGSYLSFIEMIKSGCTCINDMYFLPEYTIKAALETGVRLQTTRTLISENIKQRLGELKNLIIKYKRNNNISLNIGIHGLYTTKPEDLKIFLEFARNENLHVHIHFCENEQEVDEIKKTYNVKSPVDIITNYFKDIPTILAHCVELTDNDIIKLSVLDKISISHCPISNLKLGCGVANIKEMLNKNLNISLGTDGQGSGCNLDIFETMKATALLQKGLNKDPKEIQAYDVLKMATINGAKALGLDDKIGSIEDGKKADLIILDINSEKMNPLNNIISNIVYNAKGNNVDTTIINGKILMENKNINYINETEIFKKCNSIINRIILN